MAGPPVTGRIRAFAAEMKGEKAMLHGQQSGADIGALAGPAKGI